MVKHKLGIFNNFTGRLKPALAWFLPALALLTFIASWMGLFPQGLVEYWFARRLFPGISFLASRFSDALPFSWLDAGLVLALAALILLIRARRFRLMASLIAAVYLIFFWSWGLNYHRQPLAARLPFDPDRAKPGTIDRLVERTAEEINRLYRAKEKRVGDDAGIQAEAVRRVSRVVGVIDGSEWAAASRIKTSWLAGAWFGMAGIEGLFNPFGHEPIVSASLLDIERPFVMAHELGHVRGYPSEGDANMIAFLATILSEDPALQYSGWMNLWLYLRSPEADALLEAGPRQDLLRIFERSRRERVRWISNIQASILDWYLKANSVHDGVRSYAQLVLLAAGTEPYWDRFR
jgi:hypothetical protein